MSPLLQTVDLTVRYGGNVALNSVSLEMGQGELVGLIGPNGAGKTTFIDALTGFTHCSGRVLVEGIDISSAKPHERVRHGLGRTWQGAELYDELTVRENLEVGARRPGWRTLVRELVTGSSESMPDIEKAASLLGIDDVLDASPDDLSQGKRKLVDVARALTAGSRLLCLDEPAAGLDSHESGELGRKLRSLVDDGCSLLLVDHDIDLVLGVCDRIYVLDLGAVIAHGTPDAIRGSAAVIEAYLGQDENEEVTS